MYIYIWSVCVLSYLLKNVEHQREVVSVIFRLAWFSTSQEHTAKHFYKEKNGPFILYLIKNIVTCTLTSRAFY